MHPWHLYLFVPTPWQIILEWSVDVRFWLPVLFMPVSVVLFGMVHIKMATLLTLLFWYAGCLAHRCPKSTLVMYDISTLPTTFFFFFKQKGKFCPFYCWSIDDNFFPTFINRTLVVSFLFDFLFLLFSFPFQCYCLFLWQCSGGFLLLNIPKCCTFFFFFLPI